MAKPNSLTNSLTQLENTLAEYFIKKAPALPENIKELLVQFAPWLTVLGVIFGIPAVLSLFGIGNMAPYAYYGMRGFGGGTFMLAGLFMAAALALQAMAISGLFAHSRQGWQYLFYAMLVNVVYWLITFNLGALVIGSLLGMYLLFQVRSYYK